MPVALAACALFSTVVIAGCAGAPDASDGSAPPASDARAPAVDASVLPDSAPPADLAPPPRPDGGEPITIHLETVVQKLSPEFAGLNFESFPDWGADISFSEFQRAAYHDAGIQMFRYPGGEPAEWMDLLMTAKCKDGRAANWGSPPYTAVWDFGVKAGVSALMLQTNPTPQFCGAQPQDSSGAHAAAIVKDALAHSVNVAAVEVGNEPDLGNSWYGKNGGLAAYTTKFIEQASAIHAASPGTRVYGPVTCGLGGNCSFPVDWDSKWIDGFLAQTGDKAAGPGKGTVDGISFHLYVHPEWGYSDLMKAKIDKYGLAGYWVNTMMPYLKAQIAQHDSRDLPVAVSEVSLGNGTMSAVLQTLDLVGGFARSGLRSFQWFDANAQGPSDYWVITKNQATLIYYAFAAWAQMGGEVLDVTSPIAPHDVAVYATRRAGGGFQVMLINKTGVARDLNLGFTGGSPVGLTIRETTVLPMGGAEGAKAVLYNGANNPLPGALPAPRLFVNGDWYPRYTIAPWSIAVLAFAP